MDRREKNLTLLATILGSSIVFLDGTVVNVALPAIQEGLDTGLATQQWVVEAYLLTLVAVLLVGGSLGDLYGRRRMFMIGLVGFALTSALCAVAPSGGFLIAARALQGIAGALLVPGSLAILSATFKGEERGRAIGTWTAWSGIATVIGPAGGGLLVDALDWRWIFWINLPLILVALYLARTAVRESSDPDACPGIDKVGIGLSAVGLAGPVFALIEQPREGWGSPLVLAPMLIGLLALGAFVAWESRTRAPMLPLSLFAVRNFSVANLSTLAVYAALGGALFFLSIFLQQIGDYSAFEAGLATVPITIVMFLLSRRFGGLAMKIGPRLPMSVGPLLCGVGLILLTRLDADADYLTDVLPGLLPFSLGLAMTVAPLTATVLDAVEDRRAGIASGVNNAVSRVASLLAIAVLGAVISAQFAGSAERGAAERALPAEGSAALVAAGENPFAGAETEGLPAGLAAEVEAVADDAAVDAFRLGTLIAGIIALAGGIIAAVGIVNPARLKPANPPCGTEPNPCAEPAVAVGTQSA